MKVFRIFSISREYIVFKCPLCGWIFRRALEMFINKNIEKIKCSKCDELFSMKNNQLNDDPLHRTKTCDEIMIKPNQEIKFLQRLQIETPEIKTANEFS